MGLSLSTSGGFSQSSVSSTSITITVPANAAVGLLVNYEGGTAFQGYFAGTCTDTGGNTYTNAGGGSFGPTAYCDSFYILNTGSSATSITYTVNAAYASTSIIDLAAWVWTVSGGTANFGSQSNNGQSAVGTGTDAITTNSVTCAAGSVVMGFTLSPGGTGPISAGTGFISDYTQFNVLQAEHGAFSSNHAATFTTATGADNTLSNAISFGFTASSGVSVAWWK
jgi:hypothetical protein